MGCIWQCMRKMFMNKIRAILDTANTLYCKSQKPDVKIFSTFIHMERNEHRGTMSTKSVKPEHGPQCTAYSSKTGLKMKKLSVEGNIAVGKSSFLRLLAKAFQEWSFKLEPLKKWQHVRSSSSDGMDNLLQLMYDNPARWSYTFQTFSCMTRFKTQIDPSSEQLLKPQEAVRIFERSVYSDRFVFAKTLFELGHMNDMEWSMYQEWHTFLLTEFGEKAALDGILYLRATPTKCFERLQKRARKEEVRLTQQYLEKLHDQHEGWLINKKTDAHSEPICNIPVLVLEVDEDFEDNPVVGQHLVNKVKDFVVAL
ncbi:deoxyguanosine kinase, mitochondrial-like [Mantella aurantiaca]